MSDDDELVPECPEDAEVNAWGCFVHALELDEPTARSLFWVCFRPPRMAQGLGTA